MIFDTHCHLGWDGEDPREPYERARARGVTGFLLVGIDLATSRAMAALAPTLPGASWSAGLHPNSASEFGATWDELAKLCAEPECVAIGETGLDFYRDRASPLEQGRALRAHLELANQLRKPVVLHCRDAFAALFEELEATRPHAGVMHCFSGGVPEARRALDLGLHLSFAGPLTYPKSETLREAARFAPADRILVETDAPFLPPQPWRGKRNEPAYLEATVAKLAEVRGITLAQAAECTTANAHRLFGVVSAAR